MSRLRSAMVQSSIKDAVSIETNALMKKREKEGERDGNARQLIE